MEDVECWLKDGVWLDDVDLVKLTKIGAEILGKQGLGGKTGTADVETVNVFVTGIFSTLPLSFKPNPLVATCLGGCFEVRLGKLRAVVKWNVADSIPLIPTPYTIDSKSYSILHWWCWIVAYT